MSDPRLVPMMDITGGLGAQWVAELSEPAAKALGNISITVLRRIASGPAARNAAREASARHYAAANYR